MTITLEAIYEQGILRLMQPVDIPEGTSVKVIISSNNLTPMGKSPADILAEIASLPLEGDQENFSGQDHDHILYSQFSIKLSLVFKVITSLSMGQKR